MENKEPIKVAMYMRVGSASQLTHKAAIYARCNQKDAFALEMQLNKLREYAQQNHYEVVKEYTDYGCDAPADRKGMASLIAAAKTGEVNTLLVLGVDRLSRKTEEMLALAEMFDAEGVNIILVNNPGANIHDLVNLISKFSDM